MSSSYLLQGRYIESLAVILDFSCKEIVNGAFLEIGDSNIHIAKAELIIAEKFRALCSNKHDPNNNFLPRSKDFYDIFILYVEKYNRSPGTKVIKEIRTYIERCFSIKDMPIELLKTLEESSQREFHRRNFQEQVLDTLDRESKYVDVTFEQTYSETLEFLDTIMNI